MNSLETPYEKEFKSVINDSNLLYNSKLAITGNLRDSNFRSLHWKNSWNRCFDYKDIKTAIEQDVIRT
ncbi:hypothetical protein A3Q56_07843 [Intoshia linei]|uniref:Uncharacterized protein n=1 Tax=Intoshia linei TaxID=1819745 RepID=A0A177AT73_9BILA|nr:hypothetical protein A3Q56_07843 [Intoshia linei]